MADDQPERAAADAPADALALDALFPVVYDELRRVARRHLARQGGGGTVTTTVLVHEVYLKLMDAREPAWRDRAHFFAVASRAMRFVLVDRARAQLADKRGGGRAVTLDDAAAVADRPDDLVAIDEALDRLALVSERLATVVQYRFFGGLSYDEIAEVMELSVPTIKRDWARARAWLYQFMSDSVGSDSVGSDSVGLDAGE